MNIEELKKLIDGATEGPWVLGGKEGDGKGAQGFIYCDDVFGSAVVTVSGHSFDLSVIPLNKRIENGMLVAASRTALPNALKVIAACKEALDIASSRMTTDLHIKHALAAIAEFENNTIGEQS